MESELIVAPPRAAAAGLGWRAWLILQVVLARRSRPLGRIFELDISKGGRIKRCLNIKSSPVPSAPILDAVKRSTA